MNLVSPARQLGIILSQSKWELRTWARRAQRAEPLFPERESKLQSLRKFDYVPERNSARIAYFQVNPHWTTGALQGVRYATSFARRYAEQGDHEVSATAMDVIAAINSAYVEAKGKTFFSQNLMFDNPLTSDAFINDTLEHLRQTARIGIARGDEIQIEQTLRAIAKLVRIYLAIDYGSALASRTHAHLASGYLSAEVERIVPHNMPDVLMEGVRLMGQCADMLLRAEGPQGVTVLTQKVGVISCAGAVRESYRPITSIGIEQLARLSFDLLHVRSQHIRFAAKDIRRNLEMVARLVMTVSDTPLQNIHSTCLAPYYSAVSIQGLTTRLSDLVNSVADAPPDNADAQQVIRNFAEWVDGMYETENRLLVQAIEKRSHFTFDIIHWITSVTEMLVVLSNAGACDEHTRDELRKHARWLIAVLSWAPKDKDTTSFIESFQMTETLFEAAVNAQERGCPELAGNIGKLLLSWMFKAGRFQTGWGILQRAAYGVAVLALFAGEEGTVDRLRADIAAGLAGGGLPDREVRDRAAIEIRGWAANLYREGRRGSSIEQAMAQTDHALLEPLLLEIADQISPETKGEAANYDFS